MKLQNMIRLVMLFVAITCLLGVNLVEAQQLLQGTITGFAGRSDKFVDAGNDSVADETCRQIATLVRSTNSVCRLEGRYGAGADTTNGHIRALAIRRRLMNLGVDSSRVIILDSKPGNQEVAWQIIPSTTARSAILRFGSIKGFKGGWAQKFEHPSYLRSATEQIDSLYAFMKRSPEVRLKLQGFSDPTEWTDATLNQAKNPLDWGLGGARPEWVRSQLRKLGVDETRVDILPPKQDARLGAEWRRVDWEVVTVQTGWSSGPIAAVASSLPDTVTVRAEGGRVLLIALQRFDGKAWMNIASLRDRNSVRFEVKASPKEYRIRVVFEDSDGDRLNEVATQQFVHKGGEQREFEIERPYRYRVPERFRLHGLVGVSLPFGRGKAGFGFTGAIVGDIHLGKNHGLLVGGLTEFNFGDSLFKEQSIDLIAGWRLPGNQTLSFGYGWAGNQVSRVSLQTIAPIGRLYLGAQLFKEKHALLDPLRKNRVVPVIGDYARLYEYPMPAMFGWGSQSDLRFLLGLNISKAFSLEFNMRWHRESRGFHADTTRYVDATVGGDPDLIPGYRYQPYVSDAAKWSRPTYAFTLRLRKLPFVSARF